MEMVLKLCQWSFISPSPSNSLLQIREHLKGPENSKLKVSHLLGLIKSRCCNRQEWEVWYLTNKIKCSVKQKKTG